MWWWWWWLKQGMRKVNHFTLPPTTSWSALARSPDPMLTFMMMLMLMMMVMMKMTWL